MGRECSQVSWDYRMGLTKYEQEVTEMLYHKFKKANPVILIIPCYSKQERFGNCITEEEGALEAAR